MFRSLDISYFFTWIILTSNYSIILNKEDFSAWALHYTNTFYLGTNYRQDIKYLDVRTTIPDPCPVIEPTKVSDMCKASNAVEDSDAGNDNVDSVVLRVMIQEDGCVCHVTVDNQLITSVYIEKYVNTVAPEDYPCGLAIDISNDQTNPIQCRSGHNFRFVAFSSTGVITLTSRVIRGNFTTGYCIKLSKPVNYGIKSVLKLTCDPPPSTIGATISRIQPNSTQQLTRTSTQKMTTQTYPSTEDSSGVHIGIGLGAGVFTIITIVIVIIILHKRKSPQTVIQKEEKSKSNVNENSVENSEYDGLKYNVLYVSSENDEKCVVNYSSVDRDKPHDYSKRNHNSDAQYTASHNGNCQNGYGMKKSNTVPNEAGVVSHIDLKHLSTSNGHEYAVVDKTRKKVNTKGDA